MLGAAFNKSCSESSKQESARFPRSSDHADSSFPETKRSMVWQRYRKGRVSLEIGVGS